MSLKLGRETGSLVNHLMSNASPVKPEIGMGATILSWTDRTAATVVEILSGTKIVIREDKATRTDSNGMSDAQSYEYRSDLGGSIHRVRLTKKGWVTSGGRAVSLGVRSAHYDYSF